MKFSAAYVELVQRAFFQSRLQRAFSTVGRGLCPPVCPCSAIFLPGKQNRPPRSQFCIRRISALLAQSPNASSAWKPSCILTASVRGSPRRKDSTVTQSAFHSSVLDVLDSPFLNRAVSDSSCCPFAGKAFLRTILLVQPRFSMHQSLKHH